MRRLIFALLMSVLFACLMIFTIRSWNPSESSVPLVGVGGAGDASRDPTMAPPVKIATDVSTTLLEPIPLVEAEPERYSSFSMAAQAHLKKGRSVRPSVSGVYAKSRQFNEGLFAAIELALTLGMQDEKEADANCTVSLIRDVLKKLDPKYEPHAFLFASLEVAGFSTLGMGPRSKQVDFMLAAYFADTVNSKPIGIYASSRELQQVWHFLHFLQQSNRDRTVAEGIARVLMKDKKLFARYQNLFNVYAKLMHPLPALTPVDFADLEFVDMSNAELWIKKNIGGRNKRTGIYCFPYQLPVEMLLVERFLGNDDVAASEIWQKIMDKFSQGKIDFKLNTTSGVFNYQEFALSALLSESVSVKNSSGNSPLTSRSGDLHVGRSPSVQSAPKYLLAQARVYRFLSKTLSEILPSGMLNSLYCIRESGRRDATLHTELIAMQQLLYGLYLNACEASKINHELELEAGEISDPRASLSAASEWLEHWIDDADFKTDTRYCVPIVVDKSSKKTFLWGSIGVRTFGNGNVIFLEDECVIFDRNSLTVLTSEELRKVCDREKNSKAILEALKR